MKVKTMIIFQGKERNMIKKRHIEVLLGKWHISSVQQQAVAWAFALKLLIIPGNLVYALFLESMFHFLKYLFIWQHKSLVAVCEIFNCSRQTLSCSKWDLVPWPGIEPMSPALGAWILSHWTTRKVPITNFWLWLVTENLRAMTGGCQSSEWLEHSGRGKE